MRLNRWMVAQKLVWLLASQLFAQRKLPLWYASAEDIEGHNKSSASNSKGDHLVTDDIPMNTTQVGDSPDTSSLPTMTNVAQTGPFVDLLGPTLLSLQLVDETHAQINSHSTYEVLKGKNVIGLYFSADWCGPCRRFTPELVTFFQKMNKKRGSTDKFAIIWVSRCRDVQSWGQYFTQMNGFFALPPEEAMGQRGNSLFQRYKGTSIPYLVLLEGDTADVITVDARNKIPQDKAGIGFPWRSPVVILYKLICPKSLRFILRENVTRFLEKINAIWKGIIGFDSIR